MIGGEQQGDGRQLPEHEIRQQQQRPALIAAGGSYPKIPLPTMEDGNIEAYFMSLDFWFSASGVNDDNRKYNTVMAQVPPSKLMELRPIIEALPNLNRYTYIKRALVEHFADSQQRRLQKVLSDMPLGDSKPSKLFYDMSRTSNGALSDAVLIDLWATRLPSHAQAAVAASQGTPAERVRIADAVTESMSMRNINQVEAVPSNAADYQWPGLDAIRNEIAAMFRQYSSDTRNQSRGRSRSGNRARSGKQDRSQPRRRESSIENFEHCWYHRQFGSKANACKEPCTYKKPSTAAPRC